MTLQSHLIALVVKVSSICVDLTTIWAGPFYKRSASLRSLCQHIYTSMVMGYHILIILDIFMAKGMCQRRDFPPSTTQPNAGSGKDIPEGGKGESERRGCWLPELREQGFVTAGLQLQLVCCAQVPSLVIPNLCSRSEPIRGEWRADALMRQHRVSPRELRRFGDDRGGRYSMRLGTSRIDLK